MRKKSSVYNKNACQGKIQVLLTKPKIVIVFGYSPEPVKSEETL